MARRRKSDVAPAPPPPLDPPPLPEGEADAANVAVSRGNVNASAVNARPATKPKSTADLVAMAVDFHAASEAERAKRDDLNPAVSRKRALENAIVENMVAHGFSFVGTDAGLSIELVERRMDAPDQREITEGLEDMGLTSEQIIAVQEVFRRTKRVKYDVRVVMPDDPVAADV